MSRIASPPEMIAEIEMRCRAGEGDRSIARGMGVTVHRVRRHRPLGVMSERQIAMRKLATERGGWPGSRTRAATDDGASCWPSGEDKLLTALQAAKMRPL